MTAPTVTEKRNGQFADPPLAKGDFEWRSLDEQLPLDHPARWIDRVVDELDLSAIYDRYQRVGSASHPPDLIFKGVLVQLLEGIGTPAEWFRAFRDDPAVRWISCGCRPSSSALYTFRERAGKDLERLVKLAVRRAQEAGYYSGEIRVPDWMKIRRERARRRKLHSQRMNLIRDALMAAMPPEFARPPVDASPLRLPESAAPAPRTTP